MGTNTRLLLDLVSNETAYDQNSSVDGPLIKRTLLIFQKQPD